MASESEGHDGDDAGRGGSAAADASAVDAADVEPSPELDEEPLDAVVEDEEGFFDRMLPLVEMDRRDRWIEILSAVLLAMATIASAWSAYQATRWSGEQAKATSESIALRTESVRASDLANTQANIRVGIYLDWLTAVQEDNLVRIAFLEDRMGDELKTALDAWRDSAPPGEIPAGSPFDDEFYVSAASEEARALEIEADAAREESAEANQNGDNFILLTVLFASVLFFGGVSTKFRSLRVRVAVLLLGAIVFVVATVFLISLPPNVGV